MKFAVAKLDRTVSLSEFFMLTVQTKMDTKSDFKNNCLFEKISSVVEIFAPSVIEKAVKSVQSYFETTASKNISVRKKLFL